MQFSISKTAYLTAIIMLVLAGGFGAHSASASPAVTGQDVDDKTPTNAMCPVMTDEPIDPDISIEYEGQRVYFCCVRCRRAFEREPEKYVANLAGFSEPIDKASTQHEHSSDSAHADDQTDSQQSHDDEHTHGSEESSSDEATASGSHDESNSDGHADEHGSGLPAWVKWLGKFHPTATHAPIGLLFGAALAELLLIFTGKVQFRHAAGYCVWVAALAAVTAATLGWFNGGLAIIDEDWMKTTHRWLGTGTALLSVLTLIALIRTTRTSSVQDSRSVFRLSLFATTGVLGAAGFFGGALVYGIDHYAF